MMKRIGQYILAAAGLVLAGTGAAVLLFAAPEGKPMLAFWYICIGVGCGLLGHGAGEIIRRSRMKRDSERARRIRIEQGDERNIAIMTKAKAKALNVMMLGMGVLLLAFALLEVRLLAVLLLAGVYLLGIGSVAVFYVRLNRKL